MEELLKCFFINFEAMERNTLHARYKRIAMVEYFNTLIEGCRRGEQCDVQKTVREAIICIIRFHENARNSNGSVCKMGKYHNILYIGLKLCYDWQLKDTETVATLLDHIYSCEKTFERLFVGALFGTRAPHFIAGWKSDFASQEENVRAVVFYLDHATNANLEYNFENKLTRFIDVPIESCGKATCLKIIIQLGVPDLLLMLLRFGALVYDDDDNVENVVEILLTRLNEFNRVYPYNLVSCLQLLLRVMPSLRVQPSDNRNTRNVQNLQRDTMLDRFPYLVQDCIVPISRSGFQPPELKHLCRCRIRYQLWLNYQLPNGIRSLFIPDSMQRYIDIMDD